MLHTRQAHHIKPQLLCVLVEDEHEQEARLRCDNDQFRRRHCKCEKKRPRFFPQDTNKGTIDVITWGLDNETFSGLLALVTPYIIKQDTNEL